MSFTKQNAREKEIDIEVKAMTATSWTSDPIDIGPFPTGSMHIFAEGAGTVAGRVEISNVDHPDAWVPVAPAFTAATFVTLNQGAKLARVVLTGNSGRAAAYYHGISQA
jgi:hypothetical protein